MKKGENCTKNGVKGLIIATFWVKNKYCGGWGWDYRNTQYIPLNNDQQIHLIILTFI